MLHGPPVSHSPGSFATGSLGGRAADDTGGLRRGQPPSAGLHVALLASRCPQAAARAPLLGERPQLERDNADAREIIGFPVLGHRVGWLGSWEQNGSEVGAGCRVGGAEPWRTPRPRKTPAYARDSDRCDQEVWGVARRGAGRVDRVMGRPKGDPWKNNDTIVHNRWYRPRAYAYASSGKGFTWKHPHCPRTQATTMIPVLQTMARGRVRP